jgi:MoaA/NifB/PqqE/SkfB family radical SAM enzyme
MDLSSINNRITAILKYLSLGDSIKIAVSSLCQLNCPVCQTWQLREKVGSGYLKFKDFKKFVGQYPNFKNIEIAGLGEIFLNPELDSIIEYAYEKKINLTAFIGVNLNNVSEKTLEHMVKYRFKHLTVSIDGVSNSTYQIYRKGGNLTRVIDNIKKINHYKSKYKTAYPEMTWQFIVFGHNEHELPAARKMAKDLKMGFDPVFNSEPAYSPVKDKEFVKAQMGFKSMQEWQDRQKNSWPKYSLAVCNQLLINHQINWDGRLLVCSCNLTPFAVNVFESGLEKALENEQHIYAKKMLLGKVKGREDVPCSACGVYKFREAQRCYLGLGVRLSQLALSRILIHRLLPKRFIRLLKAMMRNNINFVLQGKPLFLIKKQSEGVCTHKTIKRIIPKKHQT